jgi:digeranylgeranylglycerophospholipid reductase
MKTLEYDVVVVGAGPSGSMAARYAAKAGARTLLIEKRQEIGSPVRCGEGISKEWLPECEIPLHKSWMAREVDGAKIISPSGYNVYIEAKHAGNEVGVVIERDGFDKYCAQLAAKDGAEVMVKTSAVGFLGKNPNGSWQGVRVRSRGEPMDVKAKVIIAADGFESQVGRWAGIKTVLKPNDVVSALQYRLTGISSDDKYCEFFVGSNFAPGGYVWIFPKAEDTANVGLGVQLSKIKDKDETKMWLDKFIERMPGLKKGKMIDMVCGGVSISAPLEKTVAGNVLLVGDAARMIDPITGGGISNGAIAGKFAGQAAAESCEANDNSEEFLMRYEDYWRPRLEAHLYRNWMAKEKLAKMTDADLDLAIKIIGEAKINKLSVYNILKAIKEKAPHLVKEFESFI